MGFAASLGLPRPAQGQVPRRGPRCRQGVEAVALVPVRESPRRGHVARQLVLQQPHEKELGRIHRARQPVSLPPMSHGSRPAPAEICPMSAGQLRELPTAAQLLAPPTPQMPLSRTVGKAAWAAQPLMAAAGEPAAEAPEATAAWPALPWRCRRATCSWSHWQWSPAHAPRPHCKDIHQTYLGAENFKH